MECANQIFPLLLYMFACFALLALTVLFVHLIFTIKDVDKLVKDLNNKTSKLDTTFDLVEKSSNAVNGIAASLGGILSGKIISDMKTEAEEKRKNKKEEGKKDE